MNQLVTKGIVLSRTDYGEADRILTVLTPDRGKISLLAKGARRSKSKLAGGIELFSVSSITYIQSRGSIQTLIATRLEKHFGHIIEDIDRTMFGYNVLKVIHRATEDEPDEAYFHILEGSLDALDELTLPQNLIELWLYLQLLKHAGHTPNVLNDPEGNKLEAGETYTFSFDDMAFVSRPNASFDARHVKVLRIALASSSPKVLAQVQGTDTIIPPLVRLVKTMMETYIRM